jgi:outer membrane protein assembly factor BamB
VNKSNILFFLSSWLVFTSHLFAQPPLLWERQKDFSGGFDLLRSVSVIGNTAVTAGNASVTGGLDLAVLNYSSTGNVRWADQTPLMAGISTKVITAALGDTAFVAGYNSIVPNDSDIFVRAYNTKTGNVLWHNILGKGRDDLPQGLVAGPSAVVVVGYGGNTSVPPITALNALIRAFHPVTGQMLWEDQIDKGDSIDDIAWTVSIDGDQVFVAGTTNAISASRNMILRSYHATTGALLWEIQRTGVSPTAIDARSDRVFVAGSNNSSNAYMAAFNARNGHLIWEDASIPGTFVDVQIQDQRVIGVGSSLRGSLVRVYHATNGKVVWQHVTTPQPGFRQSISAVTSSDDVIYVTGISGQDFIYTEFLVRAYDLSKGRLLFEDRSHRNGIFGSAGLDIAISTTEVYAVGWASDSGSADFLIRAYNREAIEHKRKLLTWIFEQDLSMDIPALEF